MSSYRDLKEKLTIGLSRKSSKHLTLTEIETKMVLEVLDKQYNDKVCSEKSLFRLEDHYLGFGWTILKRLKDSTFLCGNRSLIEYKSLPLFSIEQMKFRKDLVEYVMCMQEEMLSPTFRIRHINSYTMEAFNIDSKYNMTKYNPETKNFEIFDLDKVDFDIQLIYGIYLMFSKFNAVNWRDNE